MLLTKQLLFWQNKLLYGLHEIYENILQKLVLLLEPMIQSRLQNLIDSSFDNFDIQQCHVALIQKDGKNSIVCHMTKQKNKKTKQIWSNDIVIIRYNNLIQYWYTYHRFDQSFFSILFFSFSFSFSCIDIHWVRCLIMSRYIIGTTVYVYVCWLVNTN